MNVNLYHQKSHLVSTTHFLNESYFQLLNNGITFSTIPFSSHSLLILTKFLFNELFQIVDFLDLSAPTTIVLF